MRFVEKSRAELKREESERQNIALRFVELNPGRVDELPLEDSIRRAIHTAQECRHRVQRRRACLHVATRLREVGLEELREIVQRIEVGESIRSGSRVRLADAWAHALLEDETRAIAELRELVPHLDVSRLRQLMRNLRRALEESTGSGIPSVLGFGQKKAPGAKPGGRHVSSVPGGAGKSRQTDAAPAPESGLEPAGRPGRGAGVSVRRGFGKGMAAEDEIAAAEAVAEWARETAQLERYSRRGRREERVSAGSDATPPESSGNGPRNDPSEGDDLDRKAVAKHAALLEYLTELRPRRTGPVDEGTTEVAESDDSQG